MTAIDDIRKKLRLRVQQTESDILDLEAELRVMRDLLADWSEIPEDDAMSTSSSSSSSSSDDPELPRPRQAILDLLRATPNLTATQIADKLDGQIRSRAKDQRDVIRTTLSKLVSDGKLRRDESNRHRIRQHRIRIQRSGGDGDVAN